MKNIVRGSLSADQFNRFNHLKVDLHQTTEEMVVEAINLLLRYHECGEGLREPPLPLLGSASDPTEANTCAAQFEREGRVRRRRERPNVERAAEKTNTSASAPTSTQKGPNR
jgi:hypothetical protein